MAKKAKNKGGRPRKVLTPEQVELIERLASFGLTQRQIAACLPIEDRTLRERIAAEGPTADPEVSAAYARGRANDKRTLSERHRDIALGKLADVAVSEQRKALEWRLERQHKMASKSEVMYPEGIPIETRVRFVDAEEED